MIENGKKRGQTKAHPELKVACRSACDASCVFWASSRILYIVPVKKTQLK